MRALLTARGCLPLWGILIASYFLSAPLARIASEINISYWQKFFEGILARIDEIAPKIVSEIFSGLPLPAVIAFPGGELSLTQGAFYFIIGGAFVGGGYWLMRRAVKSKSFADDFIALFILYVATRVGIGVWAAIWQPFSQIQTKTIALIVGAIVTYSAYKAHAFDDSKVFFRCLMQLGIIALLTVPGAVLEGLVAVLNGMATLGADLQVTAMMQALAVGGLALSIYVLYGVGSKKGRTAREAIEAVQKEINEALDKAKSKDE